MTRRHPPARRCRTPLPTSPLKGGRREGGGGSPPGPASGANARPPGCAPPPWKGGEERAAAARAPARRQCCRRAVAKFPNAIAPGEVGRGVDPGARRPGLSGCAGVPKARIPTLAPDPTDGDRSRFARCRRDAGAPRNMLRSIGGLSRTSKRMSVRDPPPSLPPGRGEESGRRIPRPHHHRRAGARGRRLPSSPLQGGGREGAAAAPPGQPVLARTVSTMRATEGSASRSRFSAAGSGTCGAVMRTIGPSRS